MLTLSALQTQLVQSPHVHLKRYRPFQPFLQQVNIPRKPRVTIPTSKQIQSQSQLKYVKNACFQTLPTGTNTDDISWDCSGLGTQPILDVPKEIQKLFFVTCCEKMTKPMFYFCYSLAVF